MTHSYVRNLMHCTFSTKGPYPFIDSDLESRLWPYLGVIARENRMKALAIVGTTDHMHAQLSLPRMMSFAFLREQNPILRPLQARSPFERIQHALVAPSVLKTW